MIAKDVGPDKFCILWKWILLWILPISKIGAFVFVLMDMFDGGKVREQQFMLLIGTVGPFKLQNVKVRSMDSCNYFGY